MGDGGGAGGRTLLGFTGYQWLVLAAAWVGWGFDVFDALLFNYVARLCIPSLLGPGTTPQDVTFWTGALTSVLLVGWAVGGIVFGRITDRLGRTRTLLVTMMTYALATAACAAAPNLAVLALFRFVASLGIGGEWAAGASLVAETVPERKRVQAGALLYTAAPAGLFLATFVTDLSTRRLDVLAADPDLSWRAVFLTGLVPAAAAIAIRLKVKESEAWSAREGHVPLRELFSPALRHELFPTRLRGTGSGFCYNTGRFVTALGPFLVGGVAQRAQSAEEIFSLLAWIALVPAAAILFLLAGFGEETRGRGLG
jgi:MFS family permease